MPSTPCSRNTSSAVRLPSRPLWVALSISLACSGRPERFEDCRDLSCRELQLEESWRKDPQALSRSLAAMDDPLERAVLALRLVEAHPGHTQQLCQLSLDEASHQRCVRLNQRPHLQTSPAADQAPAVQSLSPSQGAGPPALPWSSPPLLAPCPHEGLRTACQGQHALGRAADQDWAAVAAACLAVEEPRWSWECFFQAADTAITRHGGRAADAALQLCLGSGDFYSNCLAHVAMRMARLAPAANAAAPGPWLALVRNVELARSSLEAWDAELAQRLAQRCWAEIAMVAYQRTAAPSGAPLDHLPSEAQPHIRAAAAWRLWQLESRQVRSLAHWQERLQQLLDSREEAPSQRPGERWRVTPSARGSCQAPGLTWSGYLGQSERLVALDPHDDALICLLEAAARRSESSEALLREALEHPALPVRLTAARWLRGSADGAASGHEDALVRACSGGG